MRFIYRKQTPSALSALVLLYLFSTPLSAQGSSVLTEIDAVRLDGSTIRDSNAYMALGMSRDGGNSYITSARSEEEIVITAEIHPDSEHIGQTSDLFMIVRLENKSWWMKDENGNWQNWERPLKLSNLLPFQADVLLEPVIEATIISGMVSEFNGNLRFFLAYTDSDGSLTLNPIPFRLAIINSTSEKKAFTLFKDNISDNIIFGSCITCHNDGSIFIDNSRPNAPYQYVLPNNPDYLMMNFDVLKTLLGARGKEFILDKASGRTLHFGGRQLPDDSQQYRDFETFLTLLE